MKPRVLMIAYACNPAGSGEHWLGWGWAEQAARDFQVDLITTVNHQREVGERAKAIGISPHFVSISDLGRSLTTKLGGAGSWLRKIAWQNKAASLASSLHRKTPFALVHQTTFHTFRVPFASARLPIPSVWGPIAGGEHVPPGFFGNLGAAAASERRRDRVNRWWLSYPPIRKSLRQATVIFVSNKTTLAFLPEEVRVKCRVVPPNALRPEDENRAASVRPKVSGGPLQLLYVGNCVATRAIPLVFDALQKSGLADYKFKIIGAGPALEEWKRRAVGLGLGNKVEFVGKVLYAELGPYYEAADALVFPALRDSGGSALLEAMSRNVPVVCLDWAGPGEMVDADSGVKIPVDDPERTVGLMAEAFVRVQREPDWARSLAREARKRAEELFRWEAKHQIQKDCYLQLIDG